MFYGFFIFTFYTCTSTREPMGSPQCGFIIFNKFLRQYFAGLLLRRSFSFFSMCLRCAGFVALVHSSILQPIFILKHSYQCFGLTPKLLDFCFLYKMVSVLRSHQLSWQVLHTLACSSCNTSYLVPLRQVSLSLTN